MEIVYSSQKVENERLYLTPAHTYATINDFSMILGDIEKGLIPCHTGKPFPVMSECDINQNFNNQLR